MKIYTDADSPKRVQIDEKVKRELTCKNIILLGKIHSHSFEAGKRKEEKYCCELEFDSISHMESCVVTSN